MQVCCGCLRCRAGLGHVLIISIRWRVKSQASLTCSVLAAQTTCEHAVDTAVRS
jgi:hypothetical protein